LIIFLSLALQGSSGLLRADEWPQWRGPRRDGVWRETGLLEKFDSPRVKLRWRVPLSSGYSGPTVAAGRVYVSDRVIKPQAVERVHCFDWKTGKRIWSHSYDCKYGGIGYQAGPRASVLIDEDRAYSLGAVGHLYCFDAVAGKVLWQKDLRAEYRIRMPRWGIAASPVVEAGLLIVQIGGEDGAGVVALDKRSGAEKWKALPDDTTYSAPIVIEQAGRRVLVCWTAQRIVGLDPATGKLLWGFPFPWEKWPIAIASPVLHRDMLLMSEAHKGTLLLRLLAGADGPGVEKVWHRRREDDGETAALHCLQSTPLLQGDHIYGADGYGVLRCLQLESGDQVWENETAVPRNRHATIHLVQNGERVWMFNERGELIIARLSRAGFEEISRAKLIDPTTGQLRRRDGVTWSHPAFAYRHVFARNDKELVCADLSAR
jgi:outer membrane protein assembly factor BamB